MLPILPIKRSPLDRQNRELCRRIRQGTLAVDDARLAEHLRQTTLSKVEIDQPTYSGYRFSPLRQLP